MSDRPGEIEGSSSQALTYHAMTIPKSSRLLEALLPLSFVDAIQSFS